MRLYLLLLLATYLHVFSLSKIFRCNKQQEKACLAEKFFFAWFYLPHVSNYSLAKFWKTHRGDNKQYDAFESWIFERIAVCSVLLLTIKFSRCLGEDLPNPRNRPTLLLREKSLEVNKGEMKTSSSRRTGWFSYLRV